MRRKIIYVILIGVLVLPSFLFSQSLSSERIARIKNSTVKIVIDDDQTVGTGFFITEDGSVLTCWHVIEPALIRDTLKRIIDIKNVFIVLNTGEKIPVGFLTYCLEEGNRDAVGYDFCVLNMLKPRKTSFLKIGNFNNVKEGQEIYTCGFPVSIEQQFVSKGIVSTIFVDTLNSISANGKIIKMPRTQALLDLTLNGGNSGGAIMKIGNNIEDDEVIGLADFIINPIGGKKAAEIIDLLSKGIGKYDIGGVDPNKAFIYLTQILSSMSLGVSGCISTNHFLISLSRMKR